MTDAEISKFAAKHSSQLAADMKDLCGAVISKGIQVILAECVEMRLSQNKAERLLRELIDLYEATENVDTQWFLLVEKTKDFLTPNGQS